MSIKLTRRIISKLTIPRIMNFILMKLSYRWSLVSRSANHFAFPVSVSVEPTTSCNLRCPECPSGKREFSRPTGMMSSEMFDNILDQISQKVTWITFYFQGEPFLNPDFLSMVRKASDRRMFTSTSTNGHYLTDENVKKLLEAGLDKLIISIDGITQETYEKYRVGGRLKKVTEGVERLINAKRKAKVSSPFIELQFLVNSYNQHQIDGMKDYSRSIGADRVVFKTTQIYNSKNSFLVPDDSSLTRYKKDPDGNLIIDSKLDNDCYRLWHSCVVTWDGSVVPCCFDKDASHPAGNLNNKSFKEIWNDEPLKLFRKSVLGNRSSNEICRNCSEGSKVYI